MSFLSFTVKAASLAVVTAVTVTAFVLGDHEWGGRRWSDYQLTAFAETGSPRIVFVGGSNLPYGLDSKTVEHRSGQPTVNLGFNAHAGMAFMIAEVEDKLQCGDTIVAAFEFLLYFSDPAYTLYRSTEPFDGVHGAGPDLLFMVKSRPSSLNAIRTWRQGSAVGAAVAVAARYKAKRLIRQGMLNLTGGNTASRGQGDEHFPEDLGGINAQGDFIGHRGLPSRFTMPDDVPREKPLNPEAFTYLREVADRFLARGIRFVLLPQPTPVTLYERERANLDRLVGELQRVLPTESAAFRPEAYAYPESCFFDDANHLMWECRGPRTDRVISDLERADYPQACGAVNPGVLLSSKSAVPGTRGRRP